MLLRDEDLVYMIEKEGILEGFKKETAWYHKESLVQPCSIDLHVGSIFVPDTPPKDSGGVSNPKFDHILGPGETILVTTEERLKLPNSLAAFGFPPARLSSQGILMTNPGHVDAGFEGAMRFVLINMGHKGKSMRRGDAVATLLFIRLSSNVKSGYTDRRPSSKSNSLPTDQLDSLARDFIDFREQARDIAKAEVKEADLEVKKAGFQVAEQAARVPFQSAGIAAFASVLIATLSLLGGCLAEPWTKEDSKIKQELQEKITALESEMKDVENDVESIGARLSLAELERRIEALEQEVSENGDSVQSGQ